MSRPTETDPYGPDAPAAQLTAEDLATPAPYEKGAPAEPALRNVVTHVVQSMDFAEAGYAGFGEARAAVREGRHAEAVLVELQARLAKGKRDRARLEKRRALAGRHHGYDVEYVEDEDVYLLRGPKDPGVNYALKADLPDRNRRWDPYRYDGAGAWVVAAKSHRLLKGVLERVPTLRADAAEAERERRAAEAAAEAEGRRVQAEADAAARARYEAVCGEYGSVRVRLVTKTARSGRAYPGVQLAFPKGDRANAVAKGAGLYWDGAGYSRGLDKVAPDAVEATARAVDAAVAEDRAAAARDREEARRPAEPPAAVAEPRGVLEFWEDASGLRTAKGSVPDGLWHEMRRAGEVSHLSREMAEDMDEFHLAHDPHWQPGWIYGRAAVDRALAAGYHVRVTLESGRDVLATGAGWRGEVEADRDRARAEAEERAAVRAEFAAAERAVRAALRPSSGAAYVDDEYAPPGSDLAGEFEAEIGAGREVAFGGGAGAAEHWAVALGGAGWGGPNLYKSGSWLVVGPRHLYEVRSNSHDGDAWARSNVRSGLAVRTPRTADLDAALATMLRLAGRDDDLSDGAIARDREARERAAQERREAEAEKAEGRRVASNLRDVVRHLRLDTVDADGAVVRSSRFGAKVAGDGLLARHDDYRARPLWSSEALRAAGRWDEAERADPGTWAATPDWMRPFALRCDVDALRARFGGDFAGFGPEAEGELWRHELPGGLEAVYSVDADGRALAAAEADPNQHVVRGATAVPHDPYAEGH